MSWSQRLIWVAKWGAVFILPTPIALAACHARIVDLGPVNWGIVNSWLSHLYNSIGLRNVPYLYSWSWTTVFIAQMGVPYAVFALIAHNLLLQGRTPIFSSQNTRRMLKCCAIAVLAVPLTLVVLRFLMPPVYMLVPFGLETYGESGEYWVAMIGMLVHVGVPHAAVCLTVQSLLGWRGKMRNGTTEAAKRIV